jgi:hypothetical protein
MKKSTLFVPILFILLLNIFTIFSCNNNDNPIETSEHYQFDLARFNWNYIFLPYNAGYYVAPWSPDTNEVFLSNSFTNDITHFKNGQIDLINFGENIRVGYIAGFNPTEGYLICAELKDNIWQPHIKRWNGNSFEVVPINHNFKKRFTASTVLIKSSTEMWFAGIGVIHKFDGYNLTQYYLSDTNMWGTGIFYDENNHLKYLTTYSNEEIDSVQKDYVYEFNGNDWNKIYEDNTYPIATKFYRILGNSIFSFNGRQIMKLEGNILKLFMNLPDDIGLTLPFVGTSFNDFMAFGNSWDMKISLFHWNGMKWSNEGKYDLPAQICGTELKNNYYCWSMCDFSLIQPVLLRGFKK